MRTGNGTQGLAEPSPGRLFSLRLLFRSCLPSLVEVELPKRLSAWAPVPSVSWPK